MKAISLLITSVFLFSLGTGVLAQETPEPEQSTVRGEAELPDPGLTPDSPFYFLERITEAVGTFFTFGDVKKAERYTALAAERLAEANAMREEEKLKLAEKTLERYENQLEKALFRVEKADTKGKDIKEVAKTITEATYKHLIVLNKTLEGAPEEVRPAIERAMTTSVKGHEKAVEALKAKGALGEVPEGASLPAEIPEEVRERIQKKAQEELEIEKAERAKENGLQSFEVFKTKCLESGASPEMCESLVKDIQSSKSLRTLCIKRGGPLEMCEKLPDQCLESFEAIETFCIEVGGPSDICASLEAKCRELGVTTPDECFLIMSIATTESYATPSLSEEEMEARRKSEEE